MLTSSKKLRWESFPSPFQNHSPSKKDASLGYGPYAEREGTGNACAERPSVLDGALGTEPESDVSAKGDINGAVEFDEEEGGTVLGVFVLSAGGLLFVRARRMVTASQYSCKSPNLLSDSG